MTPATCDREDEILDALHSGLWNDDQRAHAAQCAGCRDLLAATRALLEPDPAAAAPPSASFLWWKGQLQAQRQAAERFERPLAIAEYAGVVGVLSALGLLANWMVAGAALGIALPVAWYWQRSRQAE